MRSFEPATGSALSALSGQRRRHDPANSAIDLQERERKRIGFDLHDGPAQTMSAALLQIRMLEDVDAEALHQGLEELRATLATALNEIYDLIEHLGGRDSDTDDLVSRIETCVQGFTGRYGITVELDVQGACGEISRSMEIAAFRIVQEALSNAGRHSGASRVRVSVRMSPAELSCEITDDGTGFSPHDARASHRGREAFGLTSMSERARLLDGECAVESAPGQGTRVQVRIPVWHR